MFCPACYALIYDVLMVSSNVEKVRRKNVGSFIKLPQCMRFCPYDRPICDVFHGHTHTDAHGHTHTDTQTPTRTHTHTHTHKHTRNHRHTRTHGHTHTHTRTHTHTHTHTCRGREVRTCDFAPRTEDPIKTLIKTKLFKIFENKLQKWI